MSQDATRLETTTGADPDERRGLAPPDLSGQTLGDFHLLRKLGEGGMGQVYLAEQCSLKRRVALKLLRSDLAQNETSRRRFEAEAKAVAQLSHANIVQVYNVGQHAGMLYMALEYVDGRNLRDYLSRKGVPELPAALSIIRQVAAALQRAAEFGIVHRDIKPENILITRKGEVKVADFGLARVFTENQPATNLTQTGTALGTPLYMSPEQVEGKPVDHRTDIYSLGVTCYHLLAGQPPFEGETAFAVALQHVQNEPLALSELRPDLPKELSAIVAKMMAKRPAERYQTAREILQDIKRLTQALKGAGASAQPLLAVAAPPTPAGLNPAARDGPPFVDLPFHLSRKWQLGIAVAGSLLAVIGLGAGLGYAFRPLDSGSDGWPAPPASTLSEVAKESLVNKEQALRTLVHDTRKPGSNADAIRHGVQHRIDLGLHLLKERDTDSDALARADKFFQELTQSSVEQYQLIGNIGEAMVLAFQDKPKESNAQLVKVVEKGPGRMLGTLPDPEFRAMLSRALQRNYDNLVYSKEEDKFPPRLNALRIIGGGLRLPAPGDLRGKPGAPKPGPGG